MLKDNNRNWKKVQQVQMKINNNKKKMMIKNKKNKF
jgi:hypothetical protein